MYLGYNKMVKKIQINISNRTYYSLIAIGLLVLVAGIFVVNAYGTSNPPVFGHSWEEVACSNCIDAGNIGNIGACSNICTDAQGLADCSQCDSRFLQSETDPTIPSGFIVVKSYNSKGFFFIRDDYPQVSFNAFPDDRPDFYCDFRLSGGNAQIRARAGAGCIGPWVASTQQAECITGGGSMRCRLGMEEMWGDSAPGGTSWKNLWDSKPFNFRPF